ncbi:MAG: metal-dependent phosphohydrolase, partial [Rhizobacter sp.]|nr:metal-dependent phosphohydrolase [Chlorobiales bacterium]
ARVIATVDFYDALTTTRPYKPTLSRERSFEIMNEETVAGRWDPVLMKIFQEMIVSGEIDKPLSEIEPVSFATA